MIVFSNVDYVCRRIMDCIESLCIGNIDIACNILRYLCDSFRIYTGNYT